jgi:histidyl-tRNA synthetase
MGGPMGMGGCGFAAGIERIVDLMKRNDFEVPRKDILEIFVAATGLVAKKHALPILVKLREEGFNAVGVLGKTSMEEQLKRADKFKVPYTILMGDIEIKKEQLIIRDMKLGKSRTVGAKNIVEEIKKLFPKKKK